MKRYILMLLLCVFGFISNANAQIQYYRTTGYSSAKVVNGRYYWSDWESSDMLISINLNTDVITIFSPKRQIYSVYKSGNAYTDNSGGKQIKFYVIDQDGDRGTVRLRIETNGNSQLYVDFSNIAFCWNVVREE